MSRNNILFIKLLGIFLLGLFVGSCGVVRDYKAYEGEATNIGELAVIRGEYRVQQRSLAENYDVQDYIFVQIVAVDEKKISGKLSRTPQGVLVEPGKRYIVAKYNNGQAYAFGRLWLDVEKGKTYIVKAQIKNYSVAFWVQDKQTGDRVGGKPDNELEGNRVAWPINSYHGTGVIYSLSPY